MLEALNPIRSESQFGIDLLVIGKEGACETNCFHMPLLILYYFHAFGRIAVAVRHPAAGCSSGKFSLFSVLPMGWLVHDIVAAHLFVFDFVENFVVAV